MLPRRPLAAVLALAPFILFLTIYVPAAGHGFVRDDYAWIVWSRVRTLDDLARILGSDIGFYRPVVGLTFALNEWMFGTEPRGFGLTNVALAIACAAAIVSLGRSLRLSQNVALLAGALWLLQVPAMRASVLWISGRTALVVTLAATLCASNLVRGRAYPAIGWLIIALFAKEEALLLPVILFVWLFILRKAITESTVHPRTWAMGSAAAIAIYIAARTAANATTLWSAPTFYQVGFDLRVVAGHAIAYATQAAMLAGPIVVLALLALGRARPFMNAHTIAVVSCGVVWAAGAYALTVWLPNRSELYGVLPGVGVCLVVAGLCGRLWAHAAPRRQTLTLAAALVGIVLLAPVHVAASREWIRRGDFAAVVLEDLKMFVTSMPTPGAVVIADNRNDPHGNLASVFGTMAADACELALGRRIEIWIDPPPPYAASAGLIAPCADCISLRLALTNGRLQRIEHRQALGTGH